MTDDRLLVVGEFTTINGQRRPGYAQFARKSWSYGPSGDATPEPVKG